MRDQWALDCRDYDTEKGEWGWTRAPPVSQKLGGDASSSPKKARRKVRRPHIQMALASDSIPETSQGGLANVLYNVRARLIDSVGGCMCSVRAIISYDMTWVSEWAARMICLS